MLEEYLKRHEAFIRQLLLSTAELDWNQVGRYHREQVAFMQHERLIHLLVTLFFGLFTLITLLAAVAHPRLELVLLVLLFVLLLVPYIVHYYKLENGVQRWYGLAIEIERSAGHPAPDPGAPRPSRVSS